MIELVTEAPDEVADLLTSADITYGAGISYRQCDFWVRSGYLKPERTWRGHYRGSGSPRVWLKSELDVARAMARLVRAGLPPEAAHKVARSGESRTELAPGIWLEMGPPLSPRCERGDCEMCFPDGPADCSHGCHEPDGG